MSIILNGSWAPLIPWPDLSLLFLLAFVTILMESVILWVWFEVEFKPLPFHKILVPVLFVNLASFIFGLFIFEMWLMAM